MKRYETGNSPFKSETKTSLSDVLSLFSDNSFEGISPMDFRNAFFTTWENSIIRMSHSGSIDYIGIDRNDIKKKIFLGKKEISGLQIMTPDLLSSDVDIFLFNTKEDGSGDDLKISLLSGLDPNKWSLAPFIHVYNDDPKTNLKIENQIGDVEITAKNVILNGSIWPSESEISDMKINPRKISKNDSQLILNEKNHLEFKTIESIDNSDLTFTDDRETMIDIGGIPKGSTFKNVPLIEVIRQIVYPYLPPKIEIDLKNKCLERDHFNPILVEAKYQLIRRSKDIESTSISIKNSKTTISTINGSILKSNGMSSEYFDISIQIDPKKIISTNGKMKISISSYDGNESGSEYCDFEIVYPYYYGMFESSISSNIELNNNLHSFSKKIECKEDMNLYFKGIGYLYFIYDSSYGDIKDITSSGNSIINDFEKIEFSNISSSEGKWDSGKFIMMKSKNQYSFDSHVIYDFLFN